MAKTIDIHVSHGQIAVFASSLSNPYNDWNEKHVAQGFAWRRGSVSFRTMVETALHSIEVEVVDYLKNLDEQVVRAIEVPFEIPYDGAIEVGSISETVPFSLPIGCFLLRCEFMKPSGLSTESVRLTFARHETPHFAMVRMDSELSNEGGLLVTALPAIV